MFQAFIFFIFTVRDNKKAVEFAQEIEDHLVESLKRTCDTLDAVGKVSTTAVRCCISAASTALVQNRAEMVCLSKTERRKRPTSKGGSFPNLKNFQISKFRMSEGQSEDQKKFEKLNEISNI